MAVETRSQKGAATRDQILDAASRLIHLRGYHCTSLDDVLKETGIGKGNFYYYFKSKEDLGYAIIDRVIKTFVDRTLEPAFGDVTGNPLDQIAAFLDHVLAAQRARNGIGGCPMGNLACELSDVHEGFRQRLAQIFTLWHARVTAALERGQATEQLRPDFDPVGAAQFLVAALEGALLMTKVTRDIFVLETCTDELKKHLLLYRAPVVPTALELQPAGEAARRAKT
jgi:TetR/AcrR family transcriptional regulator, transcriptional repressor for nem operon